MLYSGVCAAPEKKMGGGRKVEKLPLPYYCTSAGHHVLGKKCVFIAGSFLKKSVFKAGTTVTCAESLCSLTKYYVASCDVIMRVLWCDAM